MRELPHLRGSEEYGVREDTTTSFAFLVWNGAVVPPVPLRQSGLSPHPYFSQQSLRISVSVLKRVINFERKRRI